METTDLIDWESSQSHVLLNPRMPAEEKQFINAALKSITLPSGHIWLSTSGSSGILKFAALSKKAILVSAAAVNRHLQCHATDIWINPLPIFHIGGLAIQARSYLEGGKVIASRVFGGHWNPRQFVEQMAEVKATLTALVPAQIFDLVKDGLRAPQCLRAAVVGGGALSELVYEQAVKLGWNVLPSYGSTECASQVATAPIDSYTYGKFPWLNPLDHVKLAVNEEGILRIYGESLLTCYAFFDKKKCRVEDPKVNGWLTTEDRAILENGCIHAISREGDFVKIGGESVDLSRLDKILEEVKFLLHQHEYHEMSIFAVPHDRLGHVIHLAIAAEEGTNTDEFLKNFHERVHPYERIRQVHYLDHIPKTSLQKVIRQLIPYSDK